MKDTQTHKFKALQVAKILYTPLCISFIFYFAWSNKTLLFRLYDLANIYFLITSVTIWAILHLAPPLGPKIIFAILGTPVHYNKLLTIHISRLPARYLPGGIWHTVGRLTDYRSLGISKKNLTILMVVETFFPCLITFILGGGYLWFTTKSATLADLEGGLAIISFATLLLIPIIANWQMKTHVKENFFPLYLLLILITSLFWIFASTSFLFYYSSVSLNVAQLPLQQAAASYIFAWGIGYISIFAPQGIGVFEVVAGKLMQLPMTLGGAVAFLAGYRIVTLLGDGLAWSIGTIIINRLPVEDIDNNQTDK